MTTIKSTNAGGRSPDEKEGAEVRAARPRPTDMELMLYYDGELDEAACADIEAYIERDSGAKRKLSGLRMATGLVRERALAPELSIDIASSVMSAIEAGLEVPAVKGSEGAKPINILDARRAISERSKPANDNSRGIFTLTAMAVAAAAVMMIWGRMGAEPVRSADNGLPVTSQAAPQEPERALTAEAVPAEAPAPEIDVEHGVEVAAVDFGAHMGTIFYVPMGATVSSGTTTVVWVDDEVAGGK